MDNKLEFDPDARYTIVTGANCGIGYETTKLLFSEGRPTIMMCRYLKKLILHVQPTMWDWTILF